MRAEVNSHNRHYMAHKPKIFPIEPFKKMFTDPWLTLKAVTGSPNKISSNLTVSQNKAQKYLKEYKIPVLSNIKFTMFGIKTNISRHANKQENVAHSKHINQLTDYSDI